METQQQTKQATHRLTRHVVIEYSCGCTTTRIEGGRGLRLDAPACSGHGGAAVRQMDTVMWVPAQDKGG